MLALITGASSGLGRALSLALSKRGYDLILTARNEKELKITALNLPLSTEIVPCDLANPEDRSKLVRIIQEKRPDLIVNNAGFGLYGPAHSHPVSTLEEMVEVNVQALMELSITGAQTLLSSGKKGTILNISSAAAFSPFPGMCVYAATKAFVNSFSQGLDAEVKRDGIRVLTVCPGQIDTGFRKRASRDFPQKKNGNTMSPKKAAELILKQLDKAQPLSIVDWRYRVLVNLCKFLPRSFLLAFLEKSLKERYPDDTKYQN